MAGMDKETLKEVFSWIMVVLMGFLAALIIGNFIIVNASVPTGSMMDTIPEKSRIVAFRLSYAFSEPERFDVVVFKYPDDETVLYVKRIIGMPGDTVEVHDGKVYINGSNEPLDDSFVRGIPTGSSRETYVVPEGSYFMMGDNRNNSEDSRYWNNTYVEKSKILGKVIFCYYPTVKKIK